MVSYLNGEVSNVCPIDVCMWQARAVSTDGLRPSFYTINAVVYAIQVNFLLHMRTILRNSLTFNGDF